MSPVVHSGAVIVRHKGWRMEISLREIFQLACASLLNLQPTLTHGAGRWGRWRKLVMRDEKFGLCPVVGMRAPSVIWRDFSRNRPVTLFPTCPENDGNVVAREKHQN